MIKVLVTKINTYPLEMPSVDHMAFLNQAHIDQVLRYQKIEDAWNTLIGKWLLRCLGISFGLNDNWLNKIQYSTYGKPFIPEVMGFNISHTSHCVAVALNTKGDIGIDLETCVEMDLSDFETQFSVSEMQYITKVDSEKWIRFYDLWTRKEAVSKLYGLGLGMAMSDIETSTKSAIYNNETIYLNQFIFTKTRGVLAHTEHKPDIVIEDVNYNFSL